MRYLHQNIDRRNQQTCVFAYIEPYQTTKYRLREISSPTIIQNSVTKMTRMDIVTGVTVYGVKPLSLVGHLYTIPIRDYENSLTTYNMLLEMSSMNMFGAVYSVAPQVTNSIYVSSFNNVLIPNTDFFIGMMPYFNYREMLVGFQDINNSANSLKYGGKYTLHTPYISDS